MNTRKQEIYFFAGLLVLAASLFFFIMRPYLNVLVLGGVFSIVFQPLHRKVEKKFGTRRGLAAFCTTILIFLIIFTPLTFFGFRVFGEARDLYEQLTVENSVLLRNTVEFVNTYISHLAPNFVIDTDQYFRQFVGTLIQNLGSIFSSITQILFSTFLSLLALYYFLKDGPQFIEAIVHLSPLSDHYDREILKRIEVVISSVVRGSLVVAIAQGVFAGLGFYIFGVPQAAFWGMFAVLAALIPVVGTALVVVPVATYLFLIHHTLSAIGTILWGVFLVGLIDNIFRPYLMHRDVGIHPFLILLAVLGGLQFFGPIGFLIGPVVLSFLFVLLDIYPHILEAESEHTE